MKILILGASGLVGKALVKEFSQDHDVYGTYYKTMLELNQDHQLQWDISETEKIITWVKNINPDIVISCLRGDFNVQYEIHTNLVETFKETQTKFLFCSTTNVFDGEISKHHDENDQPIAESDYGQFKIKCENLIKEVLNDRGIILRLPMVWGTHSPRLNEIKEKIKNGQEIEAYKNIFLNHAIDRKIAKQVRFIIENDLRGIFHLATTDIQSQYSFICNLVQNFTSDAKVKGLVLENIDEYNFGLLINRTDLPSNFNYDSNELIQQLVR